MPNNKKKTRTANKEGCIYYDKKRNYWRYTITLPTGERMSFCSKSRAKAVEKKNAFVENGYEKVNKTPQPQQNETKNKIKNISKTNGTIIDYCTQYIELRWYNKDFIANTYNTHRRTINRIKNSPLSLIPIEDLELKDINEFLVSQMNLAKKTQSKNREMLKWGFEYAIEEKGVPVKNLMQSKFIKKPTKETKEAKNEALTIEEQQRFIDVLEQIETDPKYQMYTYMWRLMLYLGLRVGEVCALKLSDINLNEKELKVLRTATKDENEKPIIGVKTKTKNGKRNIGLSNIVIDLIQKILSTRNPNSEFLFSDDYGHFINTSQVTRCLNILNKQYNIAKQLTSHTLRHTYATRMMELGDIPPYAIQHLLGHSSIDITLDTYTSFFKYTEEKYQNRAGEYWLQVEQQARERVMRRNNPETNETKK